MKNCNKWIKKTISLFIIVMTLSVGVYSSVFAANTSDKPYEFHNSNSSEFTDWEKKYNSTKVYIYPTSGPELNYSVRGAFTSLGSGEITASGTYRLHNGVKASITNSVRENGKLYARLHLQRTTVANTLTYGKWSPDSTRNYTVYG